MRVERDRSGGWRLAAFDAEQRDMSDHNELQRQVYQLDKELTAHEKVCAVRYEGILDGQGRILLILRWLFILVLILGVVALGKGGLADVLKAMMAAP